MNTTATPDARTRSTTSNSSSTSRVSRLEVGSSRISTRASTSVARAIDTSCCTAIECDSSGDAGSMSRCSLSSTSRGAPAHRRPVDAAEATTRLAPEHRVLRHGQVGGEVDLLVHGADAGGLRLARAVHLERLAHEEHLAAVDAVDAGERLDERRLAGAVLTEQGVDLAREQAQGHPVEGEHAGERDGDVPHLHGRLDRFRRSARCPVSRSSSLKVSRIFGANEPRPGARRHPAEARRMGSVLTVGEGRGGLLLGERGLVGDDPGRHLFAVQDRVRRCPSAVVRAAGCTRR